MPFFSNAIITLSGTVRNLNNELLEYVNPEKPTHDHSSVYFKRIYISKFDLGDQKVEAKFNTPMNIQDGDQLTVTGLNKNGAFEVLAYKNKTQQITSSENWIVLGLGALFFLAVSLGVLNSELALEGAWIPKLFAVGFVGVAFYMGYRALLIRAALKLLQGSAS